MRSKCATLLALTALAAVTVAAAACSSQDTAIATVNGQKISRGQFDQKLESLPQAKQQLSALINEALIFQYAKEKHIDATDKDVDDAMNDFKKQLPAGGFEAMLQRNGVSLEEAKNVFREQVILRKAADANLHVSDDDVKANAQVRARHILVATKKDADSVETQLQHGAKFADLAAKLSLDPGSKPKGGELGFFYPPQMTPEFAATVRQLKPGQTSAPVQSPFGWHVIQLEERKPSAGDENQIKQKLLATQEQKVIPQLVASMRSAAKIQVNDPRFADLVATSAPSAAPAPASAVPATPAAPPASAAPASAAPTSAAPAPTKK